MRVLFDVDWTLITPQGPIWPMVDLLKLLTRSPECEVYVTSGSGLGYAEDQLRRLGFGEALESARIKLVPKLLNEVRHASFDLAFDDQPVDFALVNCQVDFAVERSSR